MLTVTFTLFLNAQLTFSPVNHLIVCFIACYYPFGIPCRLYDVEEIYINALVLFILKSLPIASDQSVSLEKVVPELTDININILTYNWNYKYSIQQSTINNLFRWKLISTQTRRHTQCHRHSCSFIGRDNFLPKRICLFSSRVVIIGHNHLFVAITENG